MAVFLLKLHSELFGKTVRSACRAMQCELLCSQPWAGLRCCDQLISTWTVLKLVLIRFLNNPTGFLEVFSH